MTPEQFVDFMSSNPTHHAVIVEARRLGIELEHTVGRINDVSPKIKSKDDLVADIASTMVKPKSKPL